MTELRGVGYIMAAIYYGRSSLFNIYPTEIDKTKTIRPWGIPTQECVYVH